VIAMTRPTFKFRLYVAQGTPNSAQALSNLNALCCAHLPGRYTIEVINVLAQQQRALADRIRMTPTLIKLCPGPVQRMFGTLGETQRVLQTLGLDPSAP
jgi:circadian clock protein KaiB